MIRSKPGKRVAAFLCALLLVAHCVLWPVRARAAASALAAVGAGTVITMALMVSGIYPYDEAKQFAEYVSDNLSALWSQYLAWRTEQSMNPPESGTELSRLTGYLSSGTVVVARGVWNTLSEFVGWVASHFSLADNETNKFLGELPLVTSVVITSDLSGAVRTPILTLRSGVTLSVIVKAPQKSPVYAFLTNVGSYLKLCVFSISANGIQAYYYWSDKSPATMSSLSTYTSSAAGGAKVSRKEYDIYVGGIKSYNLSLVPYQGSITDTFEYVIAHLSPFLTSGGVTVDTTALSPIAALPSDIPWMGLQVEGAGVNAGVGAIEDIVQGAVEDREKPIVRQVEVEIAEGVTVDTETGEVAENPVVVDQADVIPAVTELVMPGSVIDTIVGALQTKFPFCLPFDIMKIAQAFVVPPSAPVISLTFHDPFSDSDFTISVDLSPWDEVAAVVRMFWTLLLLVGFSLNIPHIFLFNNVMASDFIGSVG